MGLIYCYASERRVQRALYYLVEMIHGDVWQVQEYHDANANIDSFRKWRKQVLEKIKRWMSKPEMVKRNPSFVEEFFDEQERASWFCFSILISSR